jgi:hypothetical protein
MIVDVVRGLDDQEGGSPTGGKAAERLREFLAARFGDKAPAIPPDEPDPDATAPDESSSAGLRAGPAEPDEREAGGRAKPDDERVE